MTKSMGVGRVLVAVYGVFALSASARAGYQLIREFDQAPVAYLLSAVAAVVYIVATFSLAQPAKYRALALLAVRFELAGVIIVGLLSILLPELFGHPSVWSGFGVGYGFIPLVLPVLGLIWLRRQNAEAK
ncbi:hypothetical protein IMCC13023_06940 [Candidatus Aquiluna sp. IMCC13023]|jgi:hypothetical protein|uniref:hypothetical protein n=1 Tax=Candidatus Aquiluna sp. IMCC13023 TaxID=1081644 RepID=UPI00025B361C|nr:hypothetical protein [Candidatus Aquiluna sp. IMCC13023]EIC92215.1 hypothetical protein IMCC13023_06940 [Candidatus Aquiluna sp. IMCC13023]|tara:strand:- start:385 stop:774 length:390 start_codon:yes stop_codon:yes gene_type:complete